MGFTEISNFREGGGGGSLKTSIEERIAYGGLEKLADLRGAWQERGGGVFDRGVIPQCNAHYNITLQTFLHSSKDVLFQIQVIFLYKQLFISPYAI